MHTEKNADKGYLHQKIQPPKKSYHEKMNKYVKISTHLKGAWDKIIFIKDTDKEYINQILDYTENAKHDDAPDSLASAVRELEKKGWLW
jgi:phage terminase large subunit-like protein